MWAVLQGKSAEEKTVLWMWDLKFEVHPKRLSLKLEGG